MAERTGPAARLRGLIDSRGGAGYEGPLVMPCCFDALSARLIEAAGFPLTFMSGYAARRRAWGCPIPGSFPTARWSSRDAISAPRSRSR